MEKRVKEAIRYLGFGRNAVDDQTLAMISDSFKELEQAASLKSIYRIFDFRQINDTEMMAGSLKIKSRNLGKNLRGCSDVIFFGATNRCRCSAEKIHDYRYGKNSCLAGMCSGNAGGVLRYMSEKNRGKTAKRRKISSSEI